MIDIKTIIAIAIGAIVIVGLVFIIMKITKRITRLENKLTAFEQTEESQEVLRQQQAYAHAPVPAPFNEPAFFEEFFKEATVKRARPKDGPILEEEKVQEEIQAPVDVQQEALPEELPKEQDNDEMLQLQPEHDGIVPVELEDPPSD